MMKNQKFLVPSQTIQQALFEKIYLSVLVNSYYLNSENDPGLTLWVAVQQKEYNFTSYRVMVRI